MNALKEHLNDRISIYVLLIIISGLMLYYNLVYVPTNEQKINEHALRIMENKAKILKEKYVAYQTAINSAPLTYLLHWHFALNPDAEKIFVVKNNNTFFFSDTANLLSTIKGDTIKFLKTDQYGIRIDQSLIPQVNGPQKQGRDKDIWKVKGGDYYFVYYPDITFRHVKTRQKKIVQDTAFNQYFWLKIKGFTTNIKANDFYEDLFLVRDLSDKSIYDQKKLEVSAFDSQVLDDSKLNLVRMSLPDNA